MRTDFKHGQDTELGKAERTETCQRLAKSSHTEVKMIIGMMNVILQVCSQYPDDPTYAEIRDQATVAKRNSYNLLGKLGEMCGDG